MCTGFTRDTHQYFMKASPVRPGDFIEFFAEIDLIGALSACPGGDCGASHSSDAARCYPLKVEIFRRTAEALSGWRSPPVSPYSGAGIAVRSSETLAVRSRAFNHLGRPGRAAERRCEARDQLARGVRDLVDRAIEGFGVGLRRLARSH